MSFAQVSSSDPGTHVSLALSGAFILNWVQRRFDGWREGSWQDNPHGKGFATGAWHSELFSLSPVDEQKY